MTEYERRVAKAKANIYSANEDGITSSRCISNEFVDGLSRELALSIKGFFFDDVTEWQDCMHYEDEEHEEHFSYDAKAESEEQKFLDRAEKLRTKINVAIAEFLLENGK